jgi:outer membrane receptor protein involved in Fe transport
MSALTFSWPANMQFRQVLTSDRMERPPRLPLPFGALVLSLVAVMPATAQEPAPQEARSDRQFLIEEIVVTAQKREESIHEVGMSIQAATGERLHELGITETSELFKVVTGFNSNVTYYGTPIYTIRGVGFQDTSLAAGPTVSVYIDEMPLPFSVMTQGAVLDLQRVEALKGPQGTLFGQNATGGAINYIANKPTPEFEAGVQASYGRFDTADVTGVVSGPISESLRYRVAARAVNSGSWQKSYTRDLTLPPDPYWTDNGRSYRLDSGHGGQELYNARAALLWEPSDRLSALFTASGFIDEGDSQMPQLFGFAPLNPINTLNPLVADYPLAPANNRAADWGPCVNVSGGSPANVSGDVNLSNRLYDNCEPAARDNDYYATTLRLDYGLNEDLTLTSLTSWQKFTRDQRLESDSTIYQDYESYQTGYLEAFFQELRLAGSIAGSGNWVVGANYEYTSTWDSFLQSYGISTAVPTMVLTATPLGPTNPNNRQTTDTYAIFGNVEYPVMDNVSLQGGLRYTNQKRDYRGCGNDGGDGTWADISAEIQTVLQIVLGHPVVGGLDVGPGNCGTTGPAPTFHPIASGFTDELDEDNVSWRVGVNWETAPGRLLYANVSQGYKSGSFPTVATSAVIQLEPATQEDLLAYEVGTKLRLAEGTLQLNAAAFYYDYTDKQILGAIADFVFGSLPALVNVPESHVVGGELALEWYPLDGLRLAPSISYAKSEIDGEFRNFDPFFGPSNPDTKDFSGEPFPNAPKWQGNMDAQYEWSLANGWIAFVGANLNYQSETKGFFYDRCEEPGVSCTRTDVPGLVGDPDLVINDRALLDLRAGVDGDGWSVWAWGRNVTDRHYWNQAQHVNDVLVRFTGMPRTYGVTVSFTTGG